MFLSRNILCYVISVMDHHSDGSFYVLSIFHNFHKLQFVVSDFNFST